MQGYSYGNQGVGFKLRAWGLCGFKALGSPVVQALKSLGIREAHKPKARVSFQNGPLAESITI